MTGGTLRDSGAESVGYMCGVLICEAGEQLQSVKNIASSLQENSYFEEYKICVKSAMFLKYDGFGQSHMNNISYLHRCKQIESICNELVSLLLKYRNAFFTCSS